MQEAALLPSGPPGEKPVSIKLTNYSCNQGKDPILRAAVYGLSDVNRAGGLLDSWRLRRLVLPGRWELECGCSWVAGRRCIIVTVVRWGDHRSVVQEAALLTLLQGRTCKHKLRNYTCKHGISTRFKAAVLRLCKVNRAGELLAGVS